MSGRSASLCFVPSTLSLWETWGLARLRLCSRPAIYDTGQRVFSRENTVKRIKVEGS
jgi:hypothetical protein